MRIGQQARKLRPSRPFWSGGGRGDILDQISAALTRPGAVVALTGAAAMGKTRLAQEVMARVQAVAIPCGIVAGDRNAELNAIMDEMARLPSPRSSGSKARALLAVDQAEDADTQNLERLIAIAEKASIAVMLAGRAKLAVMLESLASQPSCDAAIHHVELKALDVGQSAEFVVHCLNSET